MPFSPFNRWGLPSPFSRWGPVGANPLASYTFDSHAPVTLVDFDNDFFWANDAETDEATILDSGDETGCRIGAAAIPSLGTGTTVVMHGRITYADNGSSQEAQMLRMAAAADEYIQVNLRTDGGNVGKARLIGANAGGGGGTGVHDEATIMVPGSGIPFALAFTFTDSLLTGAFYGRDFVADTSGTDIFPNLDGQYMDFFAAGAATVELSWIGIYAGDIGDTARLAATGISLPLDTIGLIGQSNMVGADTYDGLGGHPARVLQYTSNDLTWTASPALRHPGYLAGTIGPDITFADDYMAAHPGSTLLFVPQAASGTGFSNNFWNPGDPNYLAAVAQISEVLSVHPGANLKGLLWLQGETEAVNDWSESQYATALDTMIAAMRAAIPGASSVPFVAGQIGTFLAVGPYPGRDAVNAAIADLPNRVANTAYASSAGLTDMGDGLHYDAASLRTMGERMYAALATLL